MPLLSLADTAVIGQLGKAGPIGAVAIGGVILSSSYWIFGFLRMGTCGLVAQARGARDLTETSAILVRGVLIAALAGLGFGWGVADLGIATLVAEWSGLGLGLWLCRGAFAGGQWHDWSRILQAGRLGRMAAVNGDIMIRTTLLTFSFTALTFFGAAFGDVTLDANQILLQFLAVFAYALDGFAFAAESLVGQAVGAGSRASRRKGAVMTSIWGAAFVLLLAMSFLAFGPAAIRFITPAIAVREAAAHYLPWMVIAPFVGLACWMLDGIFIGATRTRDMRNGAIIAMAIFAAALWMLGAIWGNHGIWAALMLSYIARAVTLWLHYPKLEASADRQPAL